MDTTIPTVTENIEDIMRDGLNLTIDRLSDGNFKAEAHWVDTFTGTRHWQGGRYFRTLQEACNFINTFIV